MKTIRVWILKQKTYQNLEQEISTILIFLRIIWYWENWSRLIIILLNKIIYYILLLIIGWIPIQYDGIVMHRDPKRIGLKSFFIMIHILEIVCGHDLRVDNDAGQGICQDRLQTIANLDPYLAVVGCNQQNDTIITCFLTDAPRPA